MTHAERISGQNSTQTFSLLPVTCLCLFSERCCFPCSCIANRRVGTVFLSKYKHDTIAGRYSCCITLKDGGGLAAKGML